MKKWMALLCLLAMTLSLLSGCARQEEAKQPVPGPEEPLPQPEQPALPEPAEPGPEDRPLPVPPTTVRIVAAGDNLIHNTVSFDAALPEGGYDFRPIYEPIREITRDADLCFLNQEVMLTGEVRGYPAMSAPYEVADAALDAGFNILSLATNHSLDRGESGLQKCLDYVHTLNFDAVLGAFSTEEASETPILLEKQGITFGLVNYTLHMNGYQLSKGNEWKVAQIDIDKMKSDLTALRPLCDYLIVSIHWGVEYSTSASEDQQNIAKMLCSWGADLIIGSHPHVLEPMTTVEYGGRECLCIYSLGNFVSNQHKAATMLGGMLDLTLEFDENRQVVRTVNAGIIPVVTHYEAKAKGFRIYPLSEYTEELAQRHGVLKYDDQFSLDYLNRLAGRVLGDWKMDWSVAG